MKYKGHQEASITSLLKRHIPLSNIAGYNLAKTRSSKIGIQAEKERKKNLAKLEDAALAWNASSSLNIYFNSLVGR